MKINAINNHVNKNFKGLWGGVSVISHATDSYSCHFETHYYYPFADEKEREIEAARNKYNSSFSIPWHKGAGIGVDTSEDVFVNSRLPFTEKQFEEYKAANNEPQANWSDEIKAVGKSLSELDLPTFLNKADFEKYEYEHAGFIKRLMIRLFKK